MARYRINIKTPDDGESFNPEIIWFNSIIECITEPMKHKQSWETAMGKHNQREDWLGIPGGFEGVDKILKDGWPKAKKLLNELTLPEVPEPESLRRKTVWGEDGDNIDLDRLREGRVEDCWSSRKRNIRRAPRTINLFADIGTDCGVEGDRVFYRGAAYLMFADMLEKAGYRVRIVAYQCLTSGWGGPGTEDMIVQVVKEADMPVDVSALASVICVIGYNRIYWHRQHQNLGNSSQCPSPFRTEMEKWLVDQFPNQMVIMGNNKMYDAKTSVAWLTNALAEVEAG